MPEAPQSVRKLVEGSEVDRDAYRRGRYGETEVRVELIDDLHFAICRQNPGDEAGKVLGWLPPPEEDFIRLVGKAATRRVSSAAVAELAAFRQQASDELRRFLTEQLALEKQLATLVEDAYGLTPEERQLLRDTRPVRDPIDVLEARLLGLYPQDRSSEYDASD